MILPLGDDGCIIIVDKLGDPRASFVNGSIVVEVFPLWSIVVHRETDDCGFVGTRRDEDILHDT